MVLDQSDCSLVQVIHTSAQKPQTSGAMHAQFGSVKKSGHCDYWINCGFRQPGCPSGSLYDMLKHVAYTGLLDSMAAAQDYSRKYSRHLSCSHARAHELYTAQLTAQCTLAVSDCTNMAGVNTCGSLDSNEGCSPGQTVVGFKLMPDDACSSEMHHDFFVKTDASDDGRGVC